MFLNTFVVLLKKEKIIHKIFFFNSIQEDNEMINFISDFLSSKLYSFIFYYTLFIPKRKSSYFPYFSSPASPLLSASIGNQFPATSFNPNPFINIMSQQSIKSKNGTKKRVFNILPVPLQNAITKSEDGQSPTCYTFVSKIIQALRHYMKS